MDEYEHLRESADHAVRPRSLEDICDECGQPFAITHAATPAAPPPEEPIAGGPIIGPLTPKQVRILDNRHHRVKNSRMCACGAVWAYCEVHRLVVTIEDRGAAIPAAPEDERMTPRTKAGRVLHDGWARHDGERNCAWCDRILAIEQEAAEAERARIDALPRPSSTPAAREDADKPIAWQPGIGRMHDQTRGNE